MASAVDAGALGLARVTEGSGLDEVGTVTGVVDLAVLPPNSFLLRKLIPPTTDKMLSSLPRSTKTTIRNKARECTRDIIIPSFGLLNVVGNVGGRIIQHVFAFLDSCFCIFFGLIHG